MEENSIFLREVDTVSSAGPRPPHFTGEARLDRGDAAPPPASSFRKRKRLALLWGVGGTVFSAVGFLAITLFEQYNDNLNELYRDLKHFNEASADLVKKDSLQRLREHLRELRKELNETAAARALTERELQAWEQERKEMTRELQSLRERLATVEGRQAATPVIIPVTKTGGIKAARGEKD